MRTFYPKRYGVVFTVQPSAARYERMEGGLQQLTEFIRSTPADSLLRRIAVDDGHTKELPRLLVRRIHFRRGGCELQMYIEKHEDTDKVMEQVFEIFAKHEWECG